MLGLVRPRGLTFQNGGKLPTPTVKGLAIKVFPLQMEIRDEGMFKYFIKPDDMNFIAESKYIELYFIA